MSDAEWDADDFEPQGLEKVAPVPVVTDKWEGEDEEDVKDNWEDEGAENTETQPGQVAIQVKKKKPLKDRLAEKEAQKKAEQEEARRKVLEAKRLETPEGQMEEKLRRQKLQEESDLRLAKEAFGITDGVGLTIDAMIPTSKEDFETFGGLLRDKIIKHEKSAFYFSFLETLYRDLAIGLEPEDLKKIGSSLTTIANEKQKLQKAKTKKKSTKATIKVGKDNTVGFEDDDYNFGGDMDDFI